MNNPLYIGNQNKDIYDSQADDSNLSEKSVNSIVNLLVLEQGKIRLIKIFNNYFNYFV